MTQETISVGIKYGYDYSMVAFYDHKEKEPIQILKDQKMFTILQYPKKSK